MKNNVVLIFLVLVVRVLNAQNYVEDMKSMYLSMTSMKTVGIKNVISMYQSPTSRPVVNSITMKRSENSIYYNAFNWEMFVNGQKTIMIDHASKMIEVRPLEEGKSDPLEQTFPDSLWTTYDSVRYSKVGELKRYLVFFKSEQYHWIEVFLTAENTLVKLIYMNKSSEEMGDSYKTEVAYEFFPVGESDPFLNQESFITRKNKTYQGVGKLASYEVMIHDFKEYYK